MWTQRDQLQAYQFLRRRIVSALQFGDANHPVAPGRRVVVATAAGLGAMLLICGGFLVLGVLRPGSGADWRTPGQILIEKESGAGFVLGADGLVHPVLNYASARLLIGGDRTTTITAKSLAGAPRGRPLGIPDAPASLAAPGALIAGPWAVCAGGPAQGSAGRGGTGEAGEAAAVTTLVIGRPAGSRRVARDQGVIVAGADGTRHLLTDGRRLRLRGNAVAALGWDAVPPTPVGDGWLGAVPEGPELALLTVTGSGAAGPRLAGRRTRVGQVLLAEGVDGENRYYLAKRDTLVPIGQTEAALIVGNPDNRAAYPDGVARPVRVSAADLTASGLVARRTEVRPYPARLPELVRGDGVLCAGGSQFWTARTPPLPAGGRALPVAAAARRSGAADQVYVTPGAGLLVAGPPGQDGASPIYLVTDQGVRFRLRDRDDAAALGYRDTPPTTVAAGLLELLPSGPELSTEAARQEVK
ncbi:type VII secretion protein EccB [Actinoplanes sp. NPDC049599]|uniref:type VII secretion protein EccB n=1 Tax=Actinoplanes sp. NPDC049599 TaxID=3363903 RepID=UPI0037AC6C77